MINSKIINFLANSTALHHGNPSLKGFVMHLPNLDAQGGLYHCTIQQLPGYCVYSYSYYTFSFPIATRAKNGMSSTHISNKTIADNPSGICQPVKQLTVPFTNHR